MATNKAIIGPVRKITAGFHTERRTIGSPPTKASTSKADLTKVSKAVVEEDSSWALRKQPSYPICAAPKGSKFKHTQTA